MTRHEIAAIACRILALWMLAQAAFSGLIWIFSMVVLLVLSIFDPSPGGTDDLKQAMVLGLPALASVLVGLLLWTMAKSFATMMVGTDPTPVARAELTTQSAMSVALVAVGVFILAVAVRELVAEAVHVLQSEYSFAEWWASASWQATLWSAVAGLIMALVLIVGARRIAGQLLPRGGT